MFCNKYRTTVFIWLYRSLICSDFLWNVNYILLVKCYKRSVNRYVTNFICSCKTLHSLACNLTYALSRNKTKTAVFFGKMLCYPHHISSHYDSEFLMRTLLINIHLNVSEIDNMKSYLSCISWDKFCKVYNFLFCSLTCVWWSMEIYRIYPDTSLRNHISRNGTVDSSW